MPYEKFFSPLFGNYRGRTKDHSLDYYRIAPVYTLYRHGKTRTSDSSGDPGPSQWILITGVWRDMGLWFDNAFWAG